MNVCTPSRVLIIYNLLNVNKAYAMSGDFPDVNNCIHSICLVTDVCVTGGNKFKSYDHVYIIGVNCQRSG